MNNPSQKDLWKANLLEFLHNCLIGISHLTCSNPTCPLVLNWGNLERKLSKKGKSALVKVTKDKFLTVDIPRLRTQRLRRTHQLNYPIPGW